MIPIFDSRVHPRPARKGGPDMNPPVGICHGFYNPCWGGAAPRDPRPREKPQGGEPPR